MANETIHDQDLVTSAAADDEIALWVVASNILKRITKANFIGATLSGDGAIVTGGHTLTVPETGTAALLAAANQFTQDQTIANDKDINFKDTGGTARSALWMTTGDDLHLGWGVQSGNYVGLSPGGVLRLAVLAATGNVGIGTAAPDEILHISKSIDGDVEAKIENTSTGTNARSILRLVDSNGLTEAATIVKYGATNSSNASRLTILNAEGDIYIATDSGVLAITDAGELKYIGTMATWLNATITSADFAANAGVGIEYKKFGDMVFLRGSVTRSADTDDVICTLPAGFRPPVSQPLTVYSSAGTGNHFITSGGAVTCTNSTPATHAYTAVFSTAAVT